LQELAYFLLSWQQCCGSWMFIPDPDFYPSRISEIPDPKTATKERGEKKFVVPFFVATNFELLKKKNCL
jgi:hypothetical protein